MSLIHESLPSSLYSIDLPDLEAFNDPKTPLKSPSLTKGPTLHPSSQGRPSLTRYNVSLWLVLMTAVLGLFELLHHGLLPAINGNSRHPRLAVMSTYSGADFLPAVAVLGYTLQKHASHMDRVLLVLDSLTLESQELKVIEKVGWRIKRAEAWPLPDRPLLPRWETALLKLQAWQQTDYDAVLILDADTIILNPLDLAFKLLLTSDSPIAVASDLAWNDVLNGHINAGAIFLKPSLRDLKRILRRSHDRNFYNVEYADQSLLNHFYAGAWLGLDVSWNLMNKWTKFPRQWNIFRPKARIIHYAGDPKPWKCSIEPDEESCTNPDEAMLLWLRKFREMYTNRQFELEDFQMGYAPKDMGYNVTEMLETAERRHS